MRRLREPCWVPPNDNDASPRAASGSPEHLLGADYFTKHGFVVLQDALPVDMARGLREEILSHHAAGKTTVNKVQFRAGDGAVELTKPHIYEADLHHPSTRQPHRCFTSLVEGGQLSMLVHALNEAFPSLRLSDGRVADPNGGDIRAGGVNRGGPPSTAAAPPTHSTATTTTTTTTPTTTTQMVTGEEGSIEAVKGSSSSSSKGPRPGVGEDHPSTASTVSIMKYVTLKMQVNEGGAFPWHYDNPGPPNMRKLTLCVYLTEDWQPGNGGELQLWPFLSDEHRCPISVAPSFNTVVLFLSDLILHRVLAFKGETGGDVDDYRAPLPPADVAAAPPAPLATTVVSARPGQPKVTCPASALSQRLGSRRRRVCFTVWLDSAFANADGEVHLREKHLQLAAVPMLRGSPLQRCLSRCVYEEAYRDSQFDCFAPGSKDVAIAVKVHEAHMKPLMSNAAVAAFVQQLRAMYVMPSAALVRHTRDGDDKLP